MPGTRHVLGPAKPDPSAGHDGFGMSAIAVRTRELKVNIAAAAGITVALQRTEVLVFAASGA